MPTNNSVTDAPLAKRKAPINPQIWVNRLTILMARTKSSIYYRHIFSRFGVQSYIIKPLLIHNPQFIAIGNHVSIRQGLRIEAIPYNSRIPSLVIGDNVNIEQNVHIICHSRVIIGNRVTITGHCAIVDTTHPHQDVNDLRRIGDRILDDNSYVEIGEDSFLGFGAVILPNVRIGRHCVIGANSTVTKDVPDYSVAVGTPAVVVSRYDAAQDRWFNV